MSASPTSPNATAHTYPRCVTPGIESQSTPKTGAELPPPGVYVRLDWLRMTGPDHKREAVQATVQEFLGGEWQVSGGARHFSRGESLEPGVQMSWGHKNEIAMIDIRGERLAFLDPDTAVHLMDAIGRHFWLATRIDGCLDFVSQRVHLYDNALASCEAGELCELRSYKPGDAYRSNGEPTERCLTLGKRSSSVCARIYDKGLQTGTAPIGNWERIEIEWKKDRALRLMNALDRSKRGWKDELTSRIAGAIDFKEVGTRRELSRRRRCDWWDRIVSDLDPAPTPPQPGTRSLEKWTGWFRSAVAPRVVQVAKLMGVPPEDFAAQLLTDVTACKKCDVIARDAMAEAADRDHVVSPPGGARAW